MRGAEKEGRKRGANNTLPAPSGTRAESSPKIKHTFFKEQTHKAKWAALMTKRVRCSNLDDDDLLPFSESHRDTTRTQEFFFFKFKISRQSDGVSNCLTAGLSYFYTNCIAVKFTASKKVTKRQRSHLFNSNRIGVFKRRSLVKPWAQLFYVISLPLLLSFLQKPNFS